MDKIILQQHGIKGYLNKNELNEKNLDNEIQCAVEVDKWKKKRERLQKITGNLQRLVSKLEGK